MKINIGPQGFKANELDKVFIKKNFGELYTVYSVPPPLPACMCLCVKDEGNLFSKSFKSNCSGCIRLDFEV